MCVCVIEYRGSGTHTHERFTTWQRRKNLNKKFYLIQIMAGLRSTEYAATLSALEMVWSVWARKGAERKSDNASNSNLMANVGGIGRIFLLRIHRKHAFAWKLPI